MTNQYVYTHISTLYTFWRKKQSSKIHTLIELYEPHFSNIHQKLGRRTPRINLEINEYTTIFSMKIT